MDIDAYQDFVCFANFHDFTLHNIPFSPLLRPFV